MKLNQNLMKPNQDPINSNQNVLKPYKNFETPNQYLMKAYQDLTKLYKKKTNQNKSRSYKS